MGGGGGGAKGGGGGAGELGARVCRDGGIKINWVVRRWNDDRA